VVRDLRDGDSGRHREAASEDEYEERDVSAHGDLLGSGVWGLSLLGGEPQARGRPPAADDMSMPPQMPTAQ
jgi:hypothetical protein